MLGEILPQRKHFDSHAPVCLVHNAIASRVRAMPFLMIAVLRQSRKGGTRGTHLDLATATLFGTLQNPFGRVRLFNNEAVTRVHHVRDGSALERLKLLLRILVELGDPFRRHWFRARRSLRRRRRHARERRCTLAQALRLATFGEERLPELEATPPDEELAKVI